MAILRYHQLKIIAFLSLLGNILLVLLFLGQDQQGAESMLFFSVQERAKGPLSSKEKSLIDFIRTRYLHPPAKSAYNLSKSKIYQVHAKSLTWKFIDSMLKNLFSDEKPGFFVEAGALDGEMLSNTLWLEMEKGWKGLLVEPDRTNFATLLRKNRKSWTSKSCLATTPYPKMTSFIGFSPPNEMSRQDKNLDWLTRSLTYEYGVGHNIPHVFTHQQIFNSLQCFPLESFLRALNITVVDFLSLDIQGGEWDVLKYFPWTEIKIRTISVEYILSGRQRGVLSPEFIKYMSRIGYKLIGTSHEPDYFYIKDGDPLLNKVKLN